jgi:translocation and assembly module TamA
MGAAAAAGHGTVRIAALAGLLSLSLFLAGCGTSRSPSGLFRSSPEAPATPPQASLSGEAGPNGAVTGETRVRAPTSNYPIEIEGPAELRAAILERTLVGRWQKRSGYEPDQFEALLARLPEEIRAIQRAAGYFDGRALISTDTPGVRIVLQPGARATVGRLVLAIEGEAGTDRRLIERLTDSWLLPEGSFFRPERWEQGKRALIDALSQSGYLRASIRDSRAEVDVQASSVALWLTIDSGPRLGIGELRISGLKAFQPQLVEDLRPFAQGEPYAIDRVLQFQQRLAQVGYFTTASVLPDLDALQKNPAAREVPLLVDLTESRLQRFAVGLGYSSDYGVRVQLAHDHRHVFGAGWQAETVLLLESLRQRAFMNLRSPLEASGWFTGVGTSAERVDIAGERVLRTQTYAGRGHRFVDGDDFFSIAHQFEQRSILLEAGESPSDSRVAWVAGWSRTLRGLDSPIDPRRGHASQLQASAASRSLGSDRSFVRLYGRSQRFWPLPIESLGMPGGVLVALIEAGAIAAKSRGDIPSENLFRAGGSQSVRGYRFQSLGVLEGASVTGGRYLAVGSLEYQFPISETRRLAVFADRGNATDSLSGFSFYAAHGVGLRWRTPVGPLLVDLARGESAGAPRLHLSVGYGF